MCAAALGEKSVRVGEKDASLARADTRLRSSPFLAFHRVLVLSLPVGRCRSRRGSVLGDYPPLQSKGNTLGVVGPWHPHFPPWVPYSLHLPGSQRWMGSLAGGTRRPEVPAKPVFLARVIFV